MAADKRNLLDVLKAELQFLELGGYAQLQRAWSPPFIFEDSPTCLNYRRTSHRYPCSQCALYPLVPIESRSQEVPCRHIPLNGGGATIETFYRTGTPEQLEWALYKWLRRTIKQMQAGSAALPRDSEQGATKTA
jgi:hypothetical protein